MTNLREQTETAPLVGVCGPIGAGKSMLVDRLAAALGFHPWPERSADNPFFASYARDRSTWAFRSQVAFILGAVEDAEAARRQPPGGVLERPAQEMLGVFVSDLHENGLLSHDELDVLTRVVELGEKLAGVPDLLIVLDGDPGRLLDRIRRRGARGDASYDLADMERLAAGYRDWRRGWKRCPVIDIDATSTDLRGTEEIHKLAARVRVELGMR
jgi:deoxyadenosine/deoxycytidine kinase